MWDYVKLIVLGAIAVLAAIAANYAHDLPYMVNAIVVMLAAAIAFVWELRHAGEVRVHPANEYMDGVVRAGVIATTFWGVVGFLVGVVIAFQLAFPALNLGGVTDGILNFGRLRPLHTSAVIFAFGGNALICTSFYVVQRTCRARLALPGLAAAMLFIGLFLRNLSATIIPSLALPFSIVGTFAIMWALNYSLDNLSLMALTIGTGFVVDDAIVMIENIVRHMEDGEDVYEAALRGASEIGFTVISLTVSLIAVFIPLLFMSGLVGRMFREFALTLTISILVSLVVSLTTTPMLCALLLKRRPPMRT